MTTATKRRKGSDVDRKKTRIFVVDDHPIVREGLAKLFRGEEDLEVCGEADDVPNALDLIAQTGPDVALVDLSLRGSNGIDLIKDIRVRHPKLPVLVLSMHDESLYAERVLRLGARGYIMKREPPAKLLDAIRRVQSGQLYMSPAVSERMLSTLSDGKSRPDQSPVERLSDRELEVFKLISRGRGRQQIAEELHISVKTVEAHRAKIQEKLKLKNSSEVLQFAIEWFRSESVN
ncbi:response regulator transcription factor [bacterium]|nr:response regulator transcription factor [bacterium]